MGTALTDHRHDLRLLAKLVRVAGRDPLAVWTGVGRAADAGEHEAGGHGERREDGADGPCPAILEHGRDEADGEREEEEEGAGGRPFGPVEGRRVGDGHGRVPRELLGERLGVEAAGGG